MHDHSTHRHIQSLNIFYFCIKATIFSIAILSDYDFFFSFCFMPSFTSTRKSTQRCGTINNFCWLKWIIIIFMENVAQFFFFGYFCFCCCAFHNNASIFVFIVISIHTKIGWTPVIVCYLDLIIIVMYPKLILRFIHMFFVVGVVVRWCLFSHSLSFISMRKKNDEKINKGWCKRVNE